MKPNHAFSGRGHATHVCKKCRALPSGYRARVDLIDELNGFLAQSFISPKNVKRLIEISELDDIETYQMARVLLEVADLYPYKRKRYARMSVQRPDLLRSVNRLFDIPNYAFRFAWAVEEEGDPDWH